MIFTDENGNKWERVEYAPTTRFLISKEQIIRPIKPMPELEVGDWYLRADSSQLYVRSEGDHDSHSKQVKEIRKANGTVWRKDNK